MRQLWKTTIEILTNFDPAPMRTRYLAQSLDFGDGAVLLKRTTSSIDPHDVGPETLAQLEVEDEDPSEGE